MSPQPLSRLRPDASTFTIGSGPLEEQAELSGLAMQVIAAWSFVDLHLNFAFSSFLKADYRVAFEMIQALSGSQSRRDALLAAARAALPDQSFADVESVLRAIKPVRDRRNEYAHHLWGSCPELPDALLLIDPKHLARYHADARHYLSLDIHRTVLMMQSLGKQIDQDRFLEEFNFPPPKLSLDDVYVYRRGDIERDIRDVDRAAELVQQLLVVLAEPSDDEARSELLTLLGSQPQSPSESP